MFSEPGAPYYSHINDTNGTNRDKTEGPNEIKETGVTS